MSKPQKRCIFCGATGMSPEHIWGDWLKKHVATTMPKHSSSMHVANPPGVPDVWSVQIRAGDPLQSKVRVVCSSCNNTWLSRIQEAAKPLLISMFTGQTCVLGEIAQTMATWAAMATMTAEHMMTERSLIAYRSRIGNGYCKTVRCLPTGEFGSGGVSGIACRTAGPIARCLSMSGSR